MSLHLSVAARNARQQALVTLLDSGSGEAVIQYYDGTQPSPGGAITNQVLICEQPLPTPVGTVVNGATTLSEIDDAMIVGSGTITWCRWLNRNGDWVLDGDVGLTDSGALIEMPVVAVYAGGLLHVSADAAHRVLTDPS